MENGQGTASWGKNTLYYCGISDPGQIRKANEDNFVILPEHCLFLVADGMGGHEAGAAASKITTESASKYMNFIMDSMDATLPNGLSEDMLIEPPIGGIIYLANNRVYQEAAGRVMGSTLVAIHFRDNDVNIANVGDSRAYILRKNQLQQLTEDHSFVYELYKAGEIKHEEMRNHPRRNVITRAIGTSEHVVPEIKRVAVETGDLLLLCSDGLTSMVNDEAIQDILNHDQDISSRCKALVQSANKAGGKDNITVLLILIG